MKITDLFEGTWVIKNKDGKEKRFKNAESPEAKEWAASSSPTKAKVAIYSDLYWEKKEEQSDDRHFVTPWKVIGSDDSAAINAVVKDHFSMKTIDWTMMKTGSTKRDGTTCATRVIRVSYEVGPDDDLGVDEVTQDSQSIVVARNPQKPNQIDFVSYGH